MLTSRVKMKAKAVRERHIILVTRCNGCPTSSMKLVLPKGEESSGQRRLRRCQRYNIIRRPTLLLLTKYCCFCGAVNGSANSLLMSAILGSVEGFSLSSDHENRKVKVVDRLGTVEKVD